METDVTSCLSEEEASSHHPVAFCSSHSFPVFVTESFRTVHDYVHPKSVFVSVVFFFFLLFSVIAVVVFACGASSLSWSSMNLCVWRPAFSFVIFVVVFSLNLRRKVFVGRSSSEGLRWKVFVGRSLSEVSVVALSLSKLPFSSSSIIQS